ncbi:36.4 kDa proline-rich protein-like, partial [Dioscorea cayenensis subsp. rotundata]|uniref:36.4 kDa proline-rich protein-like n=1 Tax=Dioscorea cayennensis subsp. rotundata TaxID=55577 RepID=A0AB40BY38_DIOCR
LLLQPSPPQTTLTLTLILTQNTLKHPKNPKPPIILPPIIGRPPITNPPVIGRPPISLPPIIGPPVIPPVFPPVTGNPPPVGNCPTPPTPTPTPTTPTPPPPPPPPLNSCPVDTLKLGACVDLLGGLVHVVIGDPVVNKCCPLLQGLVELEAAVCLCTTIRLKLLNINIYLPLALQLLLTCGKTPPPGFTCTV